MTLLLAALEQSRKQRHIAATPATSGYQAAHEHLADEMRLALLSDPQRLVDAPAYGDKQQPAADLVYDAFSSKNGDALMHELLKVVGMAASGQDAQLQALAWVARFSKEHADHHVDDLAAKWAEAA